MEQMFSLGPHDAQALHGNLSMSFIPVSFRIISTLLLSLTSFAADESREKAFEGLRNFSQILPAIYSGLSLGLQQECLEAGQEHCKRLNDLEEQFYQRLCEISLANQTKLRLGEYFSAGTNNLEAIAMKDMFVANWLPKCFAQKNTVFLAIGNAFSDYDHPSNIQAKRQLMDLLDGLRTKNIFIVYDADSLAARLIEARIPHFQRLGIGGRIVPAKSERGVIFGINNPYLRMKTILNFNHIVITPDSLIGTGLLIEQYSRSYSYYYYILGAPQMKDGLPMWASYLNQKSEEHAATTIQNITDEINSGAPFKNLGIKYEDSDSILIFDDAQKLIACFDLNFGNSAKTEGLFLPDIDMALNEMTTKDINSLVRESTAYVNQFTKMNQDEHFLTPMQGGMVLFGSGKGCNYFEPLITKCIKKFANRGMPIVTGGEKGFMEVANRVAIEKNAYSVGIIKGHAERPMDPKLHSKVIETNGYAERIPLLLHKRRMIIFAPGGPGTMKELATTFFMMSSATKIDVPLIFLSRDYYGELLEWFNSLGLPIELRAKIKIINSRTGMKKILHQEMSTKKL